MRNVSKAALAFWLWVVWPLAVAPFQVAIAQLDKRINDRYLLVGA